MVENIQTYLACSNFSSRAAAFAFNRSTWKQRKSQKSMRLNIGHILSILIMSDFQSSVCLMLSDVVMRLNAFSMHLDMPIYTKYTLGSAKTLQWCIMNDDIASFFK